MGIVVVLGSLIIDFVARAPRFPHPGEALIGDEFNTFLGGKGINQAVAAARLGSTVSLIGRVGRDSFGDAFFSALDEEGIASYITRDPVNGTGVAMITIATTSGQNAIVALPRANLFVPAEAVVAALEAVQNEQISAQSQQKSIFLAQCESSKESYVAGLRQAHAMGMMTILNAAPIPREPLEDAIFSLLDILVVNEIEAAELTHTPISSLAEAKQAALLLLARGPAHVIVTLGARGCLWTTHDQASGGVTHQALPAFKITARDTTASGDAFCGGLASALGSGSTMQTALRNASAAGALAASRMGAIPSLPTTTEMEDLLAHGEQLPTEDDQHPSGA